MEDIDGLSFKMDGKNLAAIDVIVSERLIREQKQQRKATLSIAKKGLQQRNFSTINAATAELKTPYTGLLM